jgi:hypothetical protein
LLVGQVGGIGLPHWGILVAGGSDGPPVTAVAYEIAALPDRL